MNIIYFIYRFIDNLYNIHMNNYKENMMQIIKDQIKNNNCIEYGMNHMRLMPYLLFCKYFLQLRK